MLRVIVTLLRKRDERRGSARRRTRPAMPAQVPAVGAAIVAAAAGSLAWMDLPNRGRLAVV